MGALVEVTDCATISLTAFLRELWEVLAAGVGDACAARPRQMPPVNQLSNLHERHFHDMASQEQQHNVGGNADSANTTPSVGGTSRRSLALSFAWSQRGLS